MCTLWSHAPAGPLPDRAASAPPAPSRAPPAPQAGDTLTRSTLRDGAPLRNIERDPGARGVYTKFCGYFHVVPTTHRLAGNEVRASPCAQLGASPPALPRARAAACCVGAVGQTPAHTLPPRLRDCTRAPSLP
jgi:hypothetical protein